MGRGTRAVAMVCAAALAALAAPQVASACKLVLTVPPCKDKVTVVPPNPTFLVARSLLPAFRATSKKGTRLRHTVSQVSDDYAWVTVRARPGMMIRTTQVAGSRCTSNQYRISRADYRSPDKAPIVSEISLVDEVAIQTESSPTWWVKTEWAYSADDLDRGTAASVIDTRARIPADLLAPGSVDRRLFIRITPIGPDRTDGPAWVGYVDPEQPGFVAGLSSYGTRPTSQ